MGNQYAEVLQSIVENVQCLTKKITKHTKKQESVICMEEEKQTTE